MALPEKVELKRSVGSVALPEIVELKRSQGSVETAEVKRSLGLVALPLGCRSSRLEGNLIQQVEMTKRWVRVTLEIREHCSGMLTGNMMNTVI